MALTKSNTRVVCLAALVVMATVFSSCNAAPPGPDYCVPLKDCKDSMCRAYCDSQGYGGPMDHCQKEGDMCCCPLSVAPEPTAAVELPTAKP